MSWIDKNKGTGPWDFTEQPDKWGYLNNLRWSDQQDAIDFCKAMDLPLDLSDQHLPCGHWHKVPISEEHVITGKWIAAMPQPNTPYIYLYDVLYSAVVKIDTSTTPVSLVGVLSINATYKLDAPISNTPASDTDVPQRGGYCMNKDGARIWYLFREECVVGGITKNNCELIEVDISGFIMKKVKSTIYPDLVDCDYHVFWEIITDGCSNDTYTFWLTNDYTGRIIKIRNSDHVIVDDHLFNYSDSQSGHPPTTIEVDKSNSKLYWPRIYNAAGYNACRKLYKANLDFSVIAEDVCCGTGMSTPWGQNFLRIHNGYLYHHRGYHPSSGFLMKRSLTDLAELHNCVQQLLRNIFGIKGNYLFTLWRANTITPYYYLSCLNVSDLSLVATKDVTYYCQGNVKLGWWYTNVSAMSKQTGIIALVRYHETEKRNYVACFKADSSLNLLYDEPLDYKIPDAVAIRSSEPQVWTMPG